MFPFWKTWKSKEWNLSRIFNYSNGWRMQSFHLFPWHVYISFSFFVAFFVKAMETHINVVTVVNFEEVQQNLWWHGKWLRYSTSILFTCLRSSHQKCSLRKGVLRNFAKFTGKHLCQSLFLNKVAGLRPATLLKTRVWHRCFTCEFCEISRNNVFHRISPLRWLVLKVCFLYTLTLKSPHFLHVSTQLSWYN